MAARKWWKSGVGETTVTAQLVARPGTSPLDAFAVLSTALIEPTVREIDSGRTHGRHKHIYCCRVGCYDSSCWLLLLYAIHTFVQIPHLHIST